MPKIIKGFKAYDKGLICKGFQFKEGETYETPEAKICEKGFHLCINPLDCLNYYDLWESEFTIAEALGKIDKNKEDSKITTTKIKIGAKLSFKEFVEASVNFVLEKTKYKNKDKYSAQLASSGDFAQIASSGYSAKLASSGDFAQLASSGDSAKLASSGYSAQLASSGYYAKLASSGYYAKLASSGYYAKLASSGYSAQLASSGDSAKLASSGDSAKLASSGYSAQIELNGKYSVGMCAGHNSIIKGKIGNWITLAEWEYSEEKNANIPICVKSAQIDGKILKEDTYYKLEKGEFKEVV